MNKPTKIVASVAVVLVLVVAFVVGIMIRADGQLDVIGHGSIAAFEAILTSMPDRVRAEEAGSGWLLEAPDSSVRFFWSQDLSQSALYDAMLLWDAKPFADAGLDIEKLPSRYVQSDGMLAVGVDLGDDVPAAGAVPSPLSAYGQIVKEHGDVINYHMAMDHYGVKLGDAIFEWAKDITEDTTTGEAQEKDIVFVLSPEPLIEAGVDPEAVEGWAYAQVEVEENGKMLSVYKFLKPFNLD